MLVNFSLDALIKKVLIKKKNRVYYISEVNRARGKGNEMKFSAGRTAKCDPNNSPITPRVLTERYANIEKLTVETLAIRR